MIINRIVNHQVIPEHYAERWICFKESSKYTFSSEILETIGNKYQLDIPEVEILYFTEMPERKKLFKRTKQHKGNALDIRLMISEALYKISSCFGIDFYLDFALYDLLIAHMRSAVVSVTNQRTIDESIGKIRCYRNIRKYLKS